MYCFFVFFKVVTQHHALVVVFGHNAQKHKVLIATVDEAVGVAHGAVVHFSCFEMLFPIVDEHSCHTTQDVVDFAVLLVPVHAQ